jgi:hypothetical protein
VDYDGGVAWWITMAASNGGVVDSDSRGSLIQVEKNTEVASASEDAQ